MWSRKDPSKGRQVSTTWTRLDLSETGTVTGWLAGPIEWIECHYHYRTIPCHFLISDGKLTCPVCPKSPSVTWCGYAPIYTDTGRPCVVVLREVARDLAQKIKPFAPVIAAKGKGKFGQVSLVPSLAKKDQYKSTLPQRQEPADIRPWLVRLWKEPALTGFFASGVAASDTPVSLAEQPAAVDDVPPELAARDEAAKRARRVNEIVLGEVDALFLPDGTPIRLPKPDRQRNGKHE